jgi:hypothetical protein
MIFYTCPSENRGPQAQSRLLSGQRTAASEVEACHRGGPDGSPYRWASEGLRSTQQGGRSCQGADCKHNGGVPSQADQQQ